MGRIGQRTAVIAATAPGIRSGVLERISAMRDEFSAAESVIAQAISQDPSQVIALSIGAMAEHCGVAQPTLSRFAKSLGFEGYPAMRLAIAHDLATEQSPAPAQGYEDLARLRAALVGDPTMARIAERLIAASQVEILATSEYAQAALSLAARLRGASVRAAACDRPSHWRAVSTGLAEGAVALVLADNHDDPVWSDGVPTVRGAGAAVVAITQRAPRGVNLDDVLLIPRVSRDEGLGLVIGDALVDAVVATNPGLGPEGPARPRQTWPHIRRLTLDLQPAGPASVIALTHGDQTPRPPVVVVLGDLDQVKEDGVLPGRPDNPLTPAVVAGLLNLGYSVVLVDGPGQGSRKPADVSAESLRRAGEQGLGPDLLDLGQREAPALYRGLIEAGIADPGRIALVGWWWGADQALHHLAGEPGFTAAVAFEASSSGASVAAQIGHRPVLVVSAESATAIADPNSAALHRELSAVRSGADQALELVVPAGPEALDAERMGALSDFLSRCLPVIR